METIIEKFLEIAIILVAAKFGAELMRRINQPAVIGELVIGIIIGYYGLCLLYTSPSPRDLWISRMPSSA